MATPAGDLYVHASADGVLSAKEPLFQCLGKFKMGQAGASLMNEHANWINWDVTGDSMVSCVALTPLPHKAMPVGLLSLDEVLQVLEVNGFVRVKVKTHGVAERDPARPGKFIVKAASVAVLLPNLAEGLANIGNFSGFVSVGGLKESAHLVVAHRLEFSPATKELVCDFPQVWLKKPIQMKAGDLARLSVASVLVPAVV